jgi:hypothetical protein
MQSSVEHGVFGFARTRGRFLTGAFFFAGAVFAGVAFAGAAFAGRAGGSDIACAAGAVA